MVCTKCVNLVFDCAQSASYMMFWSQTVKIKKDKYLGNNRETSWLWCLPRMCKAVHTKNAFWRVQILSRGLQKQCLILFFKARLSLRSIPLKWWPGFQTHSVFNQNSHKIFPPSLPSYFLYVDFAFVNWLQDWVHVVFNVHTTAYCLPLYYKSLCQ